MPRKKGSAGFGKDHQFGGNWTTEKLDLVAEYLVSYTAALKNTPFQKGYIDAFAGTGYRAQRESETDMSLQPLPFPDLAQKEPQDLLEGSAVRALKTTPPFDSYVFIERSPARCSQLEALRSQFPASSERYSDPPRRSEPGNPGFVQQELDFASCRTLPRPVRYAGRVEDHCRHRQDESN